MNGGLIGLRRCRVARFREPLTQAAMTAILGAAAIIVAPPQCRADSGARSSADNPVDDCAGLFEARVPVTNLIIGLCRMINGQHEQERQPITLGVRGDEPLDLPLLWADQNYVVAGPRALALSWIGGAAPFAVEIGPEGGPPAIARAGVRAQALEPVAVDLVPGAWRIVVRDAAGETVEAAFAVVPASALPPAPPDAGLERLPAALRDSAYAAWLAEQDEGRWLYEAWLRAVALAAEFEPAGYLERHLASGALWQ
jgi:hypothetical protein